MKNINTDILELSQKVISKIINKKDKVESLGIINGMDIISDYLNHRELELAFGHLEYIVTETDLKLGSDESEKMDVIAKKLGLNEN